jgi:hypothetical protein
VWLDTLNAADVATKGLGAEVRAALERRRLLLRDLGIAPDDPQRGAKIADLERRAVGKEVARQSGQACLDAAPPGFRGWLRQGPGASAYLVVSDGARFVLVRGSREAHSRVGKVVEVVRDAAGRPTIADDRALRGELARQKAGEAFARDTRRIFLRTVPEGFVGRVQPGPSGSGHLAVLDGVRFVLAPESREALALAGKTVEVARDAQGRFVGLRPRTLDRKR